MRTDTPPSDDRMIPVSALLRHADQYFGPRRINVATCLIIACGFYDDGGEHNVPHSQGCPAATVTGRRRRRGCD